jgi:hypothetical protein
MGTGGSAASLSATGAWDRVAAGDVKQCAVCHESSNRAFRRVTARNVACARAFLYWIPTLKAEPDMTQARYMVRRQADGQYYIWDHETERTAEDKSKLYTDLEFGDALDLAKSLNGTAP